jgi:hypothetical protein
VSECLCVVFRCSAGALGTRGVMRACWICFERKSESCNVIYTSIGGFSNLSEGCIARFGHGDNGRGLLSATYGECMCSLT